MNRSPIELATSRSGSQLALWTLLVFFAAANVLPVFPRAFPPVLYAAAQIIPAMLFAFIHSARVYGLRGSLSFAAISLAVGYVMEAIGVRNGFPFGHYYFTAGMGPKVFAVPILMGPAYLGMGYVAWARVIAASDDEAVWLAGPRVIGLPLAAGFAMVAWDLSFDPALSTFGRYWVWTRGGSYFGVPISNFLGWLLTNYLICQLFALYLRRRSAPSRTGNLMAADARLAVFFYAVCAAGCAARAASTPIPATVTDATGTLWRVVDINNVCALAAIFVMGPFVVLGATKLIGRPRAFRRAADEPTVRHIPSPESLPQPNELEQVP